MTLPKVDLPHPDSPTTPRVCPASIFKETSSTAWTKPAGFEKNPFLPEGNFLIKFLTSRTVLI